MQTKLKFQINAAAGCSESFELLNSCSSLLNNQSCLKMGDIRLNLNVVRIDFCQRFLQYQCGPIVISNLSRSINWPLEA